MRHWRLIVLTLLAMQLPLHAAERTISLDASATQIPRFGSIEFTLKGQVTCDNPYDPEDADLRLEIQSPSGKRIETPGFYFQPFDRHPRRRGNSEWLYPVGPGVWKFRFCPTEVGRYSGTAVLKDRQGAARSEPVSFECTPSPSKGFIRVSKKDPRYMEHDDGSPFFAVGQNIAFVNSTSYATIDKLRKLGENGANYARIWVCAEDWALGIEARKSAWGRSWDWNTPIILSPDRDGYHESSLCLKLTGEAGATLNANPAEPVALRPNTKYRLTGQLRSQQDVEASLGNEKLTLPAKRQWTKFQHEFTTAADTWWLSGPSFKLAAKGTAYLRNLSLTEAAGGPELLWEADVNRPVLGVYNQTDSFMLDQIVAAAEASDVRLQLTLFTRDHYMHLLNKENSRDYDRAIAFGKKLLRYCVARWGYSTHVATWEYFNEMNPGLPTNRFYSELGQYLEQIDPNRHLRGNSQWSAPSKDYKHPKLDTADLHFYLRPPSGEMWKDEVASVLSRWKLMEQNADKRPILFAEFGITDANWQRAPELSKDKGFVHHHNALWTSALCGFASTVCHWYWDDIEKRNGYDVYRGIANFAADIPWTTARLRPATATADKELRTVGLAGDTPPSAYLWICDPEATWWKTAMENVSLKEIKDATVTLSDLPVGTYQVQWWDTRTGKIIKQERASSAGGKLQLKPPPFTHDIACKILKPSA